MLPMLMLLFVLIAVQLDLRAVNTIINWNRNYLQCSQYNVQGGFMNTCVNSVFLQLSVMTDSHSPDPHHSFSALPQEMTESL